MVGGIASKELRVHGMGGFTPTYDWTIGTAESSYPDQLIMAGIACGDICHRCDFIAVCWSYEF
jgi:hypothetical protein